MSFRVLLHQTDLAIAPRYGSSLQTELVAEFIDVDEIADEIGVAIIISRRSHEPFLGPSFLVIAFWYGPGNPLSASIRSLLSSTTRGRKLRKRLACFCLSNFKRVGLNLSNVEYFWNNSDIDLSVVKVVLQ